MKGGRGDLLPLTITMICIGKAIAEFSSPRTEQRKCKLEISFFMICMAAILILHSQYKVQITFWSKEPKFWSLCAFNFAVMCN
jgi:hypothetical protein